MSATASRSAAAAMPAVWRDHLTALGALAAAILALLWSDAAAIVGIWLNDTTYNHCFFVLPLIAWLVWQRRAALLQLTPRVWAPGLFVVAAGAGGWLLGYAGGVALARQLGLVMMLQGSVIALLGPAVSRGLAFPLFYAVFAVPFGSEAVPFMQTLTARLATGLLGLTGVPAHLEGIFITTPAGYFEVAEACAGAKFLIAMVALGALIANLCFRSWTRRILFLVACVIVPVLANGVRAWGTIYVAEGTSVAFATGFDHIVYGFFFFAAVIALIMGVAWRFFDRRIDDPWFDPATLERVPPAHDGQRSLWRMVGFAIALLAAPMLWAGAIAMAGREDVPQSVALPQPTGWTRIAAQSTRPWAPHYAGADRIDTAVYRDAAGNEVTLVIAVFGRQAEGRELVGFGQGAIAPESEWAWTANGAAVPGGRSELIASHGETREVVSFYRVGDSLTGSGMGVKLETMKVRLIGGPQRAVAVLVSAAAPAGGSARNVIDSFIARLGPVDALADRAAGTD